jgi:hypothetical protein
VLLSLASNLLIILEAKLHKAMPLREIRLIARINIILPSKEINTREIEKT